MTDIVQGHWTLLHGDQTCRLAEACKFSLSLRGVLAGSSSHLSWGSSYGLYSDTGPGI